jgi:hypothetical protein
MSRQGVLAERAGFEPSLPQGLSITVGSGGSIDEFQPPSLRPTCERPNPSAFITRAT